MTDLAPRLLRAAFARYMTGVTVVNSRDARGGLMKTWWTASSGAPR